MTDKYKYKKDGSVFIEDEFKIITAKDLLDYLLKLETEFDLTTFTVVEHDNYFGDQNCNCIVIENNTLQLRYFRHLT